MPISDDSKNEYFDLYLAIQKDMEEAFRKAMNCPEYTYRDIPWMTIEYWQMLVDIIGVDNIKIVAMTEMPRGPDRVICRRGQFMISPQGMDNVRTYNAKTKEEENQKSNGNSC